MTTNSSKLKTLLCSIATIAFTAGVQAQDPIIYQNTNDPVGGTFIPEAPTLEFGDQIHFEGEGIIGANVTSFAFEYFSSELAGQAILRFRDNDGPLAFVDGNPTNQQAPGTIVYESPLIDLDVNFNTVELTGINIPVSNPWFTFTIEFSNLAAGQTAGLILRNPAQIGTSFDDVWVKDAAEDWSLRQIPTKTANFAAQVNGITVIPEPTTLALGVLGMGSLLGLSLARRRK